MTSNEITALIAAGAALAGAALASLVQILVLRSQHRFDTQERRSEHLHDREERRRLARAQVYTAYLRHVYSLPAALRQVFAQPEPQQSALLAEWSFQLSLVRADVVVYAPLELSDLMDKVGAGVAKANEELDKFVKAAAPKTEPENVLADYRNQFIKHVEPALEELAAAMARDADLR